LSPAPLLRHDPQGIRRVALNLAPPRRPLFKTDSARLQPSASVKAYVARRRFARAKVRNNSLQTKSHSATIHPSLIIL
jgi:hypothetical protein